MFVLPTKFKEFQDMCRDFKTVASACLQLTKLPEKLASVRLPDLIVSAIAFDESLKAKLVDGQAAVMADLSAQVRAVVPGNWRGYCIDQPDAEKVKTKLLASGVSVAISDAWGRGFAVYTSLKDTPSLWAHGCSRTSHFLYVIQKSFKSPPDKKNCHSKVVPKSFKSHS